MIIGVIPSCQQIKRSGRSSKDRAEQSLRCLGLQSLPMTFQGAAIGRERNRGCPVKTTRSRGGQRLFASRSLLLQQAHL